MANPPLVHVSYTVKVRKYLIVDFPLKALFAITFFFHVVKSLFTFRRSGLDEAVSFLDTKPKR